MKKVILIATVLCFITSLGFSQDIINLKKGGSIRAKILEIGQKEVKYKKFDNQSGPVYVIGTSAIANIHYMNGTEDTFGNQSSESNSPEAAATKTVKPTKVASSTEESKRSNFLVGFTFAYPTGLWDGTALTNQGPESFQKSQGHPVKSYSFGMIMQIGLSQNFSMFFDANINDYNQLCGLQGTDISSSWTNAQGALHWDEPGAPQTLSVNNLPTDVHFDMNTADVRLGLKYFFFHKKTRPWVGADVGIYKWTAGYYNEDNSKTYGKDSGYLPGLTYQAGMDFGLMPGTIVTLFADMTSPVAHYKIDGLFYPQWNLDWTNHVLGVVRFGVTVSFGGKKSVKKQQI